jgi:hypothetical protein
MDGPAAHITRQAIPEPHFSQTSKNERPSLTAHNQTLQEQNNECELKFGNDGAEAKKERAAEIR